MIPPRRLAVLLHQVKQHQIANCLYHNTDKSPSLYSEHLCDRSQFPLQTRLELGEHTDEVWFLAFSHDGSRLAATGKDGSIVIYDTSTFVVLHRLSVLNDAIAFVAWSPDDSKLLSCSNNHLARVWDTAVGSIETVKSVYQLTCLLGWNLYPTARSSQGRGLGRCLGPRWIDLRYRIARPPASNVPLESQGGVFAYVVGIPNSRLQHQPGWASTGRRDQREKDIRLRLSNSRGRKVRDTQGRSDMCQHQSGLTLHAG